MKFNIDFEISTIFLGKYTEAFCKFLLHQILKAITRSSKGTFYKISISVFFYRRVDQISSPLFLKNYFCKNIFFKITQKVIFPDLFIWPIYTYSTYGFFCYYPCVIKKIYIWSDINPNAQNFLEFFIWLKSCTS